MQLLTWGKMSYSFFSKQFEYRFALFIILRLEDKTLCESRDMQYVFGWGDMCGSA